ncbi:MAG: hypothetical protein R3351_09180 [Nitrospirales bacterium]|nr:hypothetical protein [Nitrospirales bacterium]
MPQTKGEMHGCIVCGRLYQLYAVYDSNGNYLDSKIMSAGGSVVKEVNRPLVACETHSQEEIERAIERVYGPNGLNED